MKTISIVALALLGQVSADELVSIGEKLRAHQKILGQKTIQDVHVDDHGFIVLGDKTVLQMTQKAQTKYTVTKPSDELCDGDKDDDRELEDARDPQDHIVDDVGFVNQWKGARVQLGSDMMAKTTLKTNLKSKSLLDKPSDELCDGDSADDKELEDENDPNDPIVDDNGFVRQWQVQLNSKINLRNKLKNKTKYEVTKPSDELCDGDSADDKELEDENDPNDDIVDDNGFVKQWLVQLNDKPSDELCDGDSADDKELEDENDPYDDIVDDNGFVRQWQVQLDSKMNLGNQDKPSDELCDGDSADDKELEDENDPDDIIVDDNGFVKQWLVQLKNKKKHHGKKHHKKNKKLLSISEALQLTRYSDELANGDKDDDRSIHEEEDPKDPVVDLNGHTNAGYGAVNPHKWREMNHIMPGTHITVPRALAQKEAETQVKDGDDVASNWAVDPHKWREMNHIMPGSHITVPRESLLQLNDSDDEPKDHTMGMTEEGHWWKDIKSLAQKAKEDDSLLLQIDSKLGKYSDELANGDKDDDKDIHEEEDMNDDVVDYRGHTNAGYGALYTNAEFSALNHVMPGSMITVPRSLAQKKSENWHQWY